MTLPVVTAMTVDDVEHIIPIERQVFKDPWTRRMYISDLTTNPLATYLVVRRSESEIGGREIPQVLAWGGFWLMLDEAHIATIASHPDWRGCGLGQWLMLELIDASIAQGATAATLEVRASNEAARALYHKLGFEDAGVRRRYYRDGEDGLIMTLAGLQDPDARMMLASSRANAIDRVGHCFESQLKVENRDE